jgi:predicted transcriptional regulator
MTRIVHPHFPVEKLPEDLRKALGNATHVRLIVEDKEADERLLAELDETLRQASEDIKAGRFFTAEEVLASIEEEFPLETNRAS